MSSPPQSRVNRRRSLFVPVCPQNLKSVLEELERGKELGVMCYVHTNIWIEPEQPEINTVTGMWNEC